MELFKEHCVAKNGPVCVDYCGRPQKSFSKCAIQSHVIVKERMMPRQRAPRGLNSNGGILQI
jgi:hypothetical protein